MKTPSNMHFQLDDYVESVATNLAQQQGMTFSTQREAQQYLNRTKKDILAQVEQGNKIFIEGLQYLREKNEGHIHGYVSSVCARFLKNLHSSKKLKTVIDDIMADERSLRFFSEAVSGFQDCGDPEKELAVISVLMALYPANPQAYICLGNLIWRKEGIEAADFYYTKIVEMIEDEAMLYFAADCAYKNGDKEKAKKFLLNAIDKTKISGDTEARAFLLEFLQKC